MCGSIGNFNKLLLYNNVVSLLLKYIDMSELVGKRASYYTLKDQDGPLSDRERVVLDKKLHRICEPLET